VLTVAGNPIADISIAVADPRVRYAWQPGSAAALRADLRRS
jgi:hypothetical protein